MNFKKIGLFFIVLLSVVCLFHKPQIAYAGGSWTENVDKSIYGKDAEVQSGESIVDSLVGDKPGFFESYLIELVVSITNGLYKLMEAVGITLDNVIYGRVGGHTLTGIAIFRFELQTGNPYGVVGSAIYKIIAGIATIFIFVTTFGKFSFAMYSNGSSQKRDAFKTSMGTSILSLALITLMPYFLDVALYLADVVLSTISNDGAAELFSTGGGFDIIQTFKDASGTSILNALIYLSTIILSLYYAALYVGYALTMVVLFICFPIVCVGMNFDKKLISTWVKQVISILLTPIMDCVLLMLPAYLGLLFPRSASMAIVQIFVCIMIVPARNIIKQLLGLGGSGLEMAGIGAMIGAVGLAKAAGGAIKQHRDGKKAAKSDESMADYYQDMANLESGGNVGLSGGGLSAGGLSSGGPSLGGMGGDTISPSSVGGAVRAGAGSASYLGSGTLGSVPGATTFANAAGSSRMTGANDVYSNLAEKHANIYNFESGAFKNLSSQKMADLYRERAAYRRSKANSSALGSLAGGALGLGSGMFMSPGVSAYMGAIGIGAGGALGEMLAEGRTGRKNNLPDPTIPYRSSTSIVPGMEVEKVSGVVEEDTSMVSMEGFNAGIVLDNSIQNAEDFRIANKPTAAMDMINICQNYCANNGEKLAGIYSSVNQTMKSEGYSDDAIKAKFKEKARNDMMSNLKASIPQNKNIRYCTDSKVNSSGMQYIYDDFDKALKNYEKGFLSDKHLNHYDWYTA